MSLLLGCLFKKGEKHFFKKNLFLCIAGFIYSSFCPGVPVRQIHGESIFWAAASSRNGGKLAGER